MKALPKNELFHVLTDNLVGAASVNAFDRWRALLFPIRTQYMKCALRPFEIQRLVIVTDYIISSYRMLKRQSTDRYEYKIRKYVFDSRTPIFF